MFRIATFPLVTDDPQNAVAQGEVRVGKSNDSQHQYQRCHDAERAADDNSYEEMAHLGSVADAVRPEACKKGEV